MILQTFGSNGGTSFPHLEGEILSENLKDGGFRARALIVVAGGLQVIGDGMQQQGRRREAELELDYRREEETAAQVRTGSEGSEMELRRRID
ncbi:hypothetical protein M0R45_034882 [Rubus argutus]|uniref:Uncharacterized protein n=1 Tax=Rubus argutus TaxID=59490 RepID=A0AAW1VRI6_RUBAR